jgi:hypothetical protein
MEVIKEKGKLIETLIDKASDYGKTSFELAKLKAVDKTSDIVSSVIPHSVVLILISSFLFFLNLGLALWIGEILGKNYFGFFVVAGFYCVIGIIMHFFLHEKVKCYLRNLLIKQLLK